MTTSVSRLIIALALAGLTTLPAVSHAASAVGWQKSLTEAFSAKTSVRAASTANLTLSGLQVVDGESLVAGDRVLVKDQTLPAQNGIYIVSAGAWTRATDSDHWGKFIGANVLVAEGTVNARSEWLSTATAGAGVINTSSLTFAKMAGTTTASLAALASSGVLVNSNGTVISRSLAAGSARLSLTNANGVAGNPTIDVVESAIVINNLNGTLSVAKGGTGVGTFTSNGVLFGNGTGAIQATAPGLSGQLLVANASGVPTFVSLSGDGSLNAAGGLTLANSGVAAGAYGSATTAPVFSVDAKGRLVSSTAVTITPAWSSITGRPTTVSGYGITDINSYAPTLTGGGASGTWGISVTGNAATASQVVVDDTRSLVDTPESFSRGVFFDFKSNTSNGLADGGTYNGVMTFRKWGSSTDWSGGAAHQLAFTDNGDLWHRTGSGTTWNGWQEMVDSSNIGAYAPSLTGTGASGTWAIGISGTAATATKLVTPRTLSATGDATWSTSFDGSANATGVLTLANSGVAAGTYGSATTAPVFTVDAKGRLTSASNVTITPAWTSISGKPTTLSGYGITDGVSVPGGAAIDKSNTNMNNLTAGGFYRGNTMGNAPDTGWWFVTVQSHENSGGAAGWTVQKATAFGANNSVPAGTTYTRSQTGGTTWTAWTASVTTANIGSYAPSLTGSGASGTWGINISGNANSVGGQSETSFLRFRGEILGDAGANAVTGLGLYRVAQSGFSGLLAQFGGVGGSTPSLQLYAHYDDELYFRTGRDSETNFDGVALTARRIVHSGNVGSYAPSLTGAGASGTWGIHITGNAASATKLATARSLGMTGDGSWSVNFDGSANVSSTFTLANSGVAAGTYGNSTTVPVFSVDAKGRVTGVTNTAIAPAWSNISSKPTTIAGYMGTDSVDVANITQRVGSGFYQYGGATQALGWPTNSGSWFHLMSTTHSNGANYYAMQLAADFYTQDLYYRSTNGNGGTAWSRVLHSGNYSGYSAFSGTVSGASLRTNTSTPGNFGSVTSSWAGGTSYPTLYSDNADRWVMHINPHISYTQPGVNGFSGSMTGSTIRMASDPGASTFWDVGVGTSSVGADRFAIGRAGNALMTISSGGTLTAYRNSGAANDGMYGSTNMELKSTDGSPVGLGFHRGNNSAVTLYHGGDGDNLLRLRRWAGGDYKILHDSNAPYAAAMNQHVRTTDGPTFDTVYTSNWFRSHGNSGWYSQSYGGGIWMQDSSWIRTYGSKNFYVQGASLLVDGTIYAGGPVQARGGVSNDQGNLALSAAGGTIVANNQLQLWAGASNGAGCGVAGALARDGANNVYVCK